MTPWSLTQLVFTLVHIHNSGKNKLTNIKAILQVNLKLYTMMGENCNAQLLPERKSLKNADSNIIIRSATQHEN